jgi:hypothetical protein
MTTQTQLQAPVDWPGTLPEWLVFFELQKAGKVHGVDFFFQSSFQGGRLEKGGQIVDFIFADPPDLAISVLGIYFHYAQGSTVQARDVVARAQLAGQGITLIFCDEDDLLSDARFYVREALAYQDHSQIARGVA